MVFGLFGHIGKDGRLLTAAVEGDFTKIPLLVARKADVNARNRQGRTCLMLIMGVANPYNPGDWADFNSVLDFLLEHGADVNLRDEEGYTALMLAAMNRLESVVEKLVTAGAEVNAKNEFGYTALMCCLGKSTREAAAALIKAGADIYTAVDESKSTRSEATFGPAYPSKNSEVHDVLRAAMKAVEQGRSIVKAIERVVEYQGFDEDEEDKRRKEKEGENTETYLVQLDLETIRVGLMKVRGTEVSMKAVGEYLLECGFRVSENGWVADARAFEASGEVIDRTWDLLSYSLNNRKFAITAFRLLR
jgi:hypothetical protein